MEENKETVEDVKVEETGETVTQTEEKTEKKAEKTYTQIDFNDLDKKLKAKYEKSMKALILLNTKNGKKVKKQQTKNKLRKKKNIRTHYLKTQV